MIFVIDFAWTHAFSSGLRVTRCCVYFWVLQGLGLHREQKPRCCISLSLLDTFTASARRPPCARSAQKSDFQKISVTHKWRLKIRKFKMATLPAFCTLGSLQNELIFRLLLKITVERITACDYSLFFWPRKGHLWGCTPVTSHACNGYELLVMQDTALPDVVVRNALAGHYVPPCLPAGR